MESIVRGSYPAVGELCSLLTTPLSSAVFPALRFIAPAEADFVEQEPTVVAIDRGASGDGERKTYD